MPKTVFAKFSVLLYDDFPSIYNIAFSVILMNLTSKLELFTEKNSAKLYKIEHNPNGTKAYIATTLATRAICNDPRIFGVAYTTLLQDACTDILTAFSDYLTEENAVVVNILRGGLNFGLREALTKAFGWNKQTTCFMSAQRARDDGDSENWHITENSYKKVYFPKTASFIIGDVVATGTSLRYGLQELLSEAYQQKVNVKNIIFFTYGGPKALEILDEIDSICKAKFPSYNKTILIYLEGCFTCPDLNTPLTIRLTGTDLVKYNSIMAPEFIKSQYESPLYPIERCIIYDAGSRAFWCKEYLEDVLQYWKENLALSERGITFKALLKERFPELNPERFGDIDLGKISREQISFFASQLH